MAANPILTQGTTITVTNGSGTPVIINGHMSISGIGSGSAKEIDVTTLASVAREFRQGLRDFGTVKISFIRNQDDLGQLELFNANALQATRVFVVTLPSSTADVITFSGFVVSLTSDIQADGVVTGDATIRITGAVVFS
jgi:hypothetical protein